MPGCAVLIGTAPPQWSEIIGFIIRTAMDRTRKREDDCEQF